MTTSRLRMDSEEMIAACPGGTIGLETKVPSGPVLFTVKVPPWKSSSVSFLAFARSTTSRIERISPVMLLPSASRMTGTTSPPSPNATA